MCELVISNFLGVSLGGVTLRTVGGMELMGCGWVVFGGRVIYFMVSVGVV